MFNKAQPPRPEAVDGKSLFYRTQPKNQKRQPKFFAYQQVSAAMRLYRAAREDAIPSGARIGDIYDYAFFTPDLKEKISKNTMGNCVIHSVLYEPRILKNMVRRGEGAFMTYYFRNEKDLEYGLEWQISAPLVKWFLMTGEITPSDSIEDQRATIQDALDEIATMPEKEFIGLYEEPLWNDCNKLMLKEPDWREIIRSHPERVVAVTDRPPQRDQPRPPRPTPVSDA